MCGGGGGSTGTTKYEWNDSLKGPWEGSVNRAIWESERPFEAYQGGDPNARIAGLSPLHNKAALNTEALTDSIASPTNAINAAQDQTTNTLQGNYLMGGNANPNTRANAFQGVNNPFFNQVVQQGQDQIRSNYENTTSPELTRLMNMSGALGGSAHTKALANNQAALGKQLSDYDASMRNQQYDRSGMMDEAALGRGMQAFEGERGRMVGSIGAGYGAQDAAMGRLQGLMQMGDMNRSYDQDVKNYGYQNFMDKRNENRYGLDFLTGLMGRAQGGFSNLTTTAPQYQVSPYSALMSGAMAYGALR
jgi:hypothetical protein